MSKRELLPKHCSSQTLVLLPGFGCGEALLLPLAESLRPHHRLIICELPAIGNAPALSVFTLDNLLAALIQQIPQGAWLAGWSLGGMLAAQLAARYPAHIQGVITLASNACFVARNDYQAAMPPEINGEFNEAFAATPDLTLKRFYGLMVQGEQERDARAWLKAMRGVAPKDIHAHWQDYLTLLANLDNRDTLKNMSVPCLHLLAERDALVPAAAAESLRKLFPSHGVKTLLGFSHSFPFIHAQETARQMMDFMTAVESGVVA